MYVQFGTNLTPVQITALPLMVKLVPNRVRAGFPSPAEDLSAERIDLTKELIPQPQATFLLRGSGDSMRETVVFDNDILVINPWNSMVVAVVDREFTVKKFYLRAGCIKLNGASPTYLDMVPKETQMGEIWGVLTASIKQLTV